MAGGAQGAVIERVEPKEKRAMPAQIVALMSVTLTVVGQVLLKLGIKQIGTVDIGELPSRLPSLLVNPYIFFGLAIYAISAMLWISALSRLDLSYAYPFISLGVVMVFFISFFLLRENLPPHRMLGAAVVVLGLLLMR
jgi:drug/metabolite transporter (DMT)-like permease